MSQKCQPVVLGSWTLAPQPERNLNYSPNLGADGIAHFIATGLKPRDNSHIEALDMRLTRAIEISLDRT
jgi:hypothetical protein